MTMVHSWPEAIAHCDADSFYLGCELARRPELKSKPAVVVGKLGSCVLAKSYDLKKRGVKTAMAAWEVKKQFPDVICLEADFQWYNHLSAKMFAILQSWTPDVETYSVDEAFLDLKGLRRLYKMDYRKIAHAIKEDVKKQLGITVSIGVSVSKTLAKMGAEVNKPDGVTIISSKDVNRWLPNFQLSDVPGLGRNSVAMLEKFNVHNCADFTNLTQDTVKKFLHQPGVRLWKELQGIKVFPVEKNFAPNKVITRTSSFQPLTADQNFLWAHTVRQLERALDALQDDHQLVKEVALYLRDKEFHKYSWSHRLPTPTKDFSILLEALKDIWREHFPREKTFRSTGVTLHRLCPDTGVQFSLFEDPGRVVQRDQLQLAKREIKDRYGKLALRAASSLRLKKLGPNVKKPLKTKAFNVEW